MTEAEIADRALADQADMAIDLYRCQQLHARISALLRHVIIRGLWTPSTGVPLMAILAKLAPAETLPNYKPCKEYEPDPELRRLLDLLEAEVPLPEFPQVVV